MHEAEKLSLEQIEKFLLATEEVRFVASQRAKLYAWVERRLCQQEYPRQERRARGLLRRYIGKMTALRRAQVTRLVAAIRTTMNTYGDVVTSEMTVASGKVTQLCGARLHLRGQLTLRWQYSACQ
jgi:hypothetical protein